MVEVVGDVLIPKEIIVPQATGKAETLTQSGSSLFMSGSALYFQHGGDVPAQVSTV